MDYATTTPLMMIVPERIQIIPVSSGVIAQYQRIMSKAVWRPAFGRKMGFLIVQDEHLLGLILLASPCLRLGKSIVIPDAVDFKGVMDMSVCVAAQPLGWHWNIGKLLAMLAYTLGDYVDAKYPESRFQGIITTSLYGGGNRTQYTDVYTYLGETKGSGHENVDDATYKKMVAFLRAHCPHCAPGCSSALEPKPSKTQIALGDSKEKWCVVPGCRWIKGVPGDGASPRRRRIAAFYSACRTLHVLPADAIGATKMGHGDNLVLVNSETSAKHHGHLRGKYWHLAVSPETRPAVMQEWMKKHGWPRFKQTTRKGYKPPPYSDGQSGGQRYT